MGGRHCVLFFIYISLCKFYALLCIRQKAEQLKATSLIQCFCTSVKTVRKDERRYYEDLMQYSREHLMLYPYHLSDVIVKGLRITPFMYYINMMQDIMVQEKSYDSLPNFTAADCKFLLCCCWWWWFFCSFITKFTNFVIEQLSCLEK